MSNPSPVAVIELDAFCERCGFNLRSQPIWRDERLGMLVCRCPECGAHQSATNRATALSPWLNRLALLATLLWVALGLAFVAALFFGFVGMQAAGVEGLTNQAVMLPDGSPVTYNYTGGKPTVVRMSDRDVPLSSTELAQRRTLIPRLGGPKLGADYGYEHDLTWLGIGLFTAAFAAAVYVGGAALAAACWFWRPGRRYAWLALPVMSTLLTFALLRQDGMGAFYESLGQHVHYEQTLGDSIAAVVLTMQLGVFALGLWSGRSLVRGILAVFAPPGVRQLLAFLWHCDGKTMPSARAAIPGNS